MPNDVSLIATLIFLWGRPVRGVFFVRCILFMQSLVYLLFAAEFVLLQHRQCCANLYAGEDAFAPGRCAK